jgi:hypothetical protein
MNERRLDAEIREAIGLLLCKVGQPFSPYEVVPRPMMISDVREIIGHYYGDVAAAFPVTFH